MERPPTVTGIGVVVAAGRGARFAAAAPDAPPKLLAPIDGQPLVRRTVMSLLDGGVHRCVVVVSDDNRDAIAAALVGLPVEVVVNVDPSREMFSSIQVGVRATPAESLCVLLPGDMPFVKPSSVAAVLAEATRSGMTVAASHGGQRGHPLALSASLRRWVCEAAPTAILRDQLTRDTSMCIDVDDPGVHRDVDRPADLVGAASRQQLRLLAAAVNAAVNGVIITDNTGTIEWVNDAVSVMTGYRRDECLGRNPRDLLKSGVHDTAFYKELWDTIRGGQVWQGEMVNRRKDGTTYPEEMTITPIRDESGDISHFIAIKRDVSKRKQLEQALAQAHRLEGVGRLAGGIAHDFNNLLTVINGYAELVLAELAADHPLRDAVEEIQRSGLRASDLTRQLLTFSRRRQQKPVVLDINAIVGDMERMLRRLIGEDITLDIDASPSTGRVKVDPAQMEQVIMNLVVNARDAMPTGGTLSIRTADVSFPEEFAATRETQPSGPYVMVLVSDSGTGMTPEVQARLFEPFFTTKETGRGTGLGLATVYGIVTESHGHISVASAPGEGTTFRIFLPAVETAAE